MSGFGGFSIRNVRRPRISSKSEHDRPATANSVRETINIRVFIEMMLFEMKLKLCLARLYWWFELNLITMKDTQPAHNAHLFNLAFRSIIIDDFWLYNWNFAIKSRSWHHQKSSSNIISLIRNSHNTQTESFWHDELRDVLLGVLLRIITHFMEWPSSLILCYVDAAEGCEIIIFIHNSPLLILSWNENNESFFRSLS